MIERQLNFLLNIVYDLLDLKMFEKNGQLLANIANFRPLKIFEFIKNLFK